jgi:hypothetical protein
MAKSFTSYREKTVGNWKRLEQLSGQTVMLF